MRLRRGETNIGMLVMIALAVIAIIVGYTMYSSHNRRLAREEEARREEARIEREKEEAERKKAAEEAEREQMRKRQERERLEAEREEKRQAEKRERERATEKKRKAMAEQESQRAFYAQAKRSFEGLEAKIVIDLPENQRLDFLGKGLPGLCVFPSFDEDGKIFYQTNDISHGCRMLVLDGQPNPQEADKTAFTSRFEHEKNIVRTETGAWVFNAPRSGASYPLPEEDAKFVPAAADLFEIYDVLKGLGVTFANVRSRLTLKSKDGKRSIPLGVIGYEDALDRKKIEELVRDRLLEGKKKSAKNLNSSKGPKLKKFRPTVVFYDGEIIKKTMNGVTHVPRSFVYHGTSRYNDGHAHVDDIKKKAKRNWEKMCEEAKRQEARAAEVEAENARIKEEYSKRQQNAKEKLSKVCDDEIEQELGNWVIQVERGKSKQKK